METVTKQYKVYTFDELDDEVKEKVIQRFREEKLQSCYLMDWWAESVEMELEKYGFEDIELHYDLGYGRYRGFGFEAGLDWEKFMERNPQLIERFKYLDKCYGILNIKQEGRYCFKNQFKCYLELEIIDEADDFNYESDEFIEMEKELEAYFEWLKDKICDRFLKDGVDAFEKAISDETIIEDIEVNEYKFLKNGEVF